MSRRPLRDALRAAAFVMAEVAVVLPAGAFQVRQTPSRFDPLVIHDPSVKAGVVAVPIERLGGTPSLAAGWETFRGALGADWEVYVDGRSGAPLFVQGPGIPWIAGPGNSLEDTSPVTIDSLETSLRAFVAKYRTVLLADDAELQLSRAASGKLTDETWQIVFDRVVQGVPVQGDRYIFLVGHGNLIEFGASRWGPITKSAAPALASFEAFDHLTAYMGITHVDPVEVLNDGTLHFVPLAAEGTDSSVYAGPVGGGYSSALVWEFVLRVAGEPGTWVGQVDAHTGETLALYDDDRYAQVKGGVYPVSDDAICPDGCEQPNYPMPFANLSINGNQQTASTMGLFTCSPSGGTATTTLAGPYVRVADVCGAVSQSVTCDANLDLRSGSGTDCTVPTGASPGNTHAARTGFYHLNRIIEKGKSWLPTVSWLNFQLTDNININDVCNAFWDGGSVNFFKSGGGCRNTGEIAGVFLHEWGHGLDQNDGGGYDNPSESYADVASLFQTHASCMGRGFFVTSHCGGYGNGCLTCTGIRDLDWNARQAHNPSTPANFVQGACGSGSGPCGREVHCEGYIAGEAVWDLATRDLPALGIDQNTSWQIADKLWYKSRFGSGGNAYNCSLPNSDGCSANSWFSKMKAIDDDDGNLVNGTPHAAAIFAAFSRHAIACSNSSDPSNRNSTVCPTLAAPTLTVIAGIGSAALSWTAVPNASTYRVLRNDAGCSAGYTIVTTVAGTSYNDSALANGNTEYYAIQAIGSNTACDGVLSNCGSATPQPFAGPHASYKAHTLILDACGSGGLGTNNALWESGERITFQVQVQDDGTQNVTGVTATVVPLTPGVTMINGTASFGSISSGSSALSAAPYFTAQLSSGLACGSLVNFRLDVSSSEGSWSSTFSQTLGLAISGTGAAIDEDFSHGIPSSWTVINGGSGGGAAATWTTTNPGGRLFTSPIFAPVAIVDSAAAGFFAQQDEQLITPVINLSGTLSVTLEFDQYFRWFNGGFSEKADVDVRSTLTGGAWVNVLRNQNFSSANPNHRTIDISAQAAGAPDVQVRFHYWDAYFEWWWEIDNVKVIFSGGSGCNMATCAPLASPPPPAPDGLTGTAMLATRTDPYGQIINLTWDVASCPAPGYHILYGDIASVSSHSLGGVVCSIGASGGYSWIGVPGGNLWFLVVSDSGGTEGTWGKLSTGANINEATASAQCGLYIRDNGGTCP